MKKKFNDDRPDFEKMTRVELTTLLDKIRGWLRDCEDSEGFLIDTGKLLGVNVSVGHYQDV